jgi:putative phosphoribosyl transferase
MEHNKERLEPKVATAPERCLFTDRTEAGAQLAAHLAHLRGRNVLVIGIARGGMPIAREVARRLDADLDVLVVRKLGAPGNPELAIGALTADGTCHLNRELVVQLGLSNGSVAHIAGLQSHEAQRLERLLREERPAEDVSGRMVVLVDDGLATGATMRTAIHAIARHGVARLIVAVPVGAIDACRELESMVDELVCPNQPKSFEAVGAYYCRFDSLTDAEVARILHDRPNRRAS